MLFEPSQVISYQMPASRPMLALLVTTGFYNPLTDFCNWDTAQAQPPFHKMLLRTHGLIGESSRTLYK